MKKVSIIVPVYHVKNYLKKSVESVLNQSYKEIELILVDDGGDDDCPGICDWYAAKDSRVRVIHKENEGQSMARKEGLAIASGEYIMYLDADDWMELNAVQQSVDIAEKTGADIVLFSYKRVYESKEFETHLFTSDRVFLNNEVKQLHRRMIGLVGPELAYVENQDRLVTMWGKLYTHECAEKGLWISERQTGSLEDAVYNLGAFEHCRKAIYINQCLYDYRKDNVSSSTSKYKKQLVNQWEELYQYFDNYINQHSLSNEYKIALSNRIALGILGIGLNELNSPKNFWEKSQFLRKLLKKERYKAAFQQLDYQYLHAEWRVFYEFCKLGWVELVMIMLYAISFLKSRISK